MLRLFISSLLVFSIFTGLVMPSVSAANNNNLMDNAVFDEKNSMSASQINTYLNNYAGSCISPNSGFAAHIPTGYNQTNGFTYGGTATAGAIIYTAAQAYNINPKVLITKLQHEQGIVKGDGPTGCGAVTMASAMGYACTDGSENRLNTYSYPEQLLTPLYYRHGTPSNKVGSGPGTGTCVNNPKLAGFSQQVINGAWLLRHDRQRSEGIINSSLYNKPGWDNTDDDNMCYSGPMTEGYRKRCPDSTLTYFNGYTVIDGQSIRVDNGATAAFYHYTPHIQSFTTIYQSLFGSAYAYIHNGVNYTPVFDPVYYLDTYPDLKTAFGSDSSGAFNHFIINGMKEGRQGHANFNVTSYRNANPDLRWAYGTKLPPYYAHYSIFGKNESRVATGSVILVPVTTYKGVNYTNTYSFSTYMANHSDLRSLFNSKNDDTGALSHFITFGMSEGRQAKADYSVASYRARYADLRVAFGNNLKPYYLHYITNGKSEGRTATGDLRGGVTTYNKVNYSAVYSFDYYSKNHSDIWKAFGLNDPAALRHFFDNGMKEGRQASPEFNVHTYKSRYTDLQQAFGNNLKSYYLHYITNGKSEGRTGV